MKKLFFHVLIICAGIIFPAFGTQPYEIRVSGISPVMFLEIWDYEAEDHDRVEIRMNGDRITEFEIKNQKQTISVPLVFEDDSTEVLVEIIGTFDGGGGVTYAVRAIGLGADTGVYRHGSAVGSGNAYRIIKEQDLLTDIWHWMFGEDEEDEEDEEDDNTRQCQHIWMLIDASDGKTISDPDQSIIERRQELRRRYRANIDRTRRDIIRLLQEKNKIPKMEYGALIYEYNGNIGFTPITEGHRDYIVSFYPWYQIFSRQEDLVYRSTLRDGKWYQCDVTTGEIDFRNPMTAKDERVPQKSLLQNQSKDDSSSWSLDWENVPEGATVVEYVHLHPDDSEFSYMDLVIAEQFGIDATVVNPTEDGEYTDVTFHPEDESFSSISDHIDDLADYHEDVLEDKNEKYIYRCLKCGEIRQLQKPWYVFW